MWDFRTWSPKGDRVQNQHYKTAPNAAIADLPIDAVAAKDCSLFVWVTFPTMGQFFSVLAQSGGELWGGFQYKTAGFVWVKSCRASNKWHRGNGKSATQANSELCLYFSRGKPARLSAGVSQIFSDYLPSDFIGLGLPVIPAFREPITHISPVTRHSEKPAGIYEQIEKLFPPPYLRLFARSKRPGWVSLGNELTGNDIREDIAIWADKESLNE